MTLGWSNEKMWQKSTYFPDCKWLQEEKTTVNLQNFGVGLFSAISLANGFTEIMKKKKKKKKKNTWMRKKHGVIAAASTDTEM